MYTNFKTLIFLTLLSSSTLFSAETGTMKLIHDAQREVGEMPAKQLKKLIDNEQAVIVLDIREANQRAEGEIYADDTFAITRGNLEFKVMTKIKDRNALIVTYCRGGKRGALAAQTLRRLGYKNATSLKGGLRGWANAGYPIETGLGVTTLTKEN